MRLKQYLKTIRILLYKYMFCVITDKKFIQIQYRIRAKKKIDFEKTRTFNEKIQKYKISYKNELMHQCVDKIAVRDYVKETLGESVAEQILIPLLAYNSNIEKINFVNFKFKLATTGNSFV